MTDPKPKIFVQIVSYRDSECHWTVKDLFEKATHPERINVGICWQYDPKEDMDCFAVEYPRADQVRVVQYHVKDSQGAGWARMEAQKLWNGEPYTMQIQAHMRFEPGWDETLIETLARCPSKKPVLTVYAPPYEPPDKFHRYPRALLRFRVRELGKPGDPQIVHLTGTAVPLQDKARCGLYPGPFWIGNFMFCKTELLSEVPNDPHIYFFGEELAYSARLYTHGWDLFQLDKLVLFHQWDRRETFSKQSYRRMTDQRNQLSLARVRHLLQFEKTDNPKALKEIGQYGLGTERSLGKFWEFTGIDWQKRTVKKDSLRGIWHVPDEAPKKRKKAAKPRIFVQIASYRDPDCQNTVLDLFEKATDSDRVFVGICWQFVEGKDDDCFRVPYPRPKQVRVHEVDAAYGRGVCWARSLTQTLWEGEEFTLQIDSHMRFEPGWDETLIRMWEECGNEKAILSCYPPGFTPPDKFERDYIFGMGADNFDKHGICLLTSTPAFPVEHPPAKPVRGAFASACMLFAPASIIRDVPYDPHVYFFGEEISMSARLWTSGYDFYHPNRLVIFHDWDRSKRPTHFMDHRYAQAMNEHSFTRIRHLLGTERCEDKGITSELDIYGLGSERTLKEYQLYSGVDFKAKTISEQAKKGQYEPAEPSPNILIRPNGSKPHLFVQIASYRDRECQWTIKDLFEKAANPDNINVGVCWQFDPEEDKDCFEVSTRPDQVRMLPVDWREAEGVCWARHQTQQLWDGEEYSLQIDAHMRFVPGWDELMLKELAACESGKPVISCNPAGYIPPNQLEKNPRPAIRRVFPFTPDGNIRGKGESLDVMPEQPLNGAFVAAGFVLGRSDLISEVPYDPYMYFDQEEISYAARLYTHGWDVFSARRQFLYHYYNDNKAGGGSVRPLHWRDLKQEDEKKINVLRTRGLKRFNHLTGFRVSEDSGIIQEIERYGLGQARSLAQYEEYSGVDFKHKIASEKALRCQFIEGLEKYRTRPIHLPELEGKPHKQPARAQAKTAPAAEIPKLPANAAMLEPGDFVPMFRMVDSNGKVRAMEGHGGRLSLFFFLPSGNPEYVAKFFKHFQQQLGPEKLPLWQLFVMDETVENINKIKKEHRLPPHVFWADRDRKLAQAFGLTRPGDKATPPAGYLLNRNLRIVTRHTGLGPARLAAAVIADYQREQKNYQSKFSATNVIREIPPVLIVPDAFSPEFCEKCINTFRKGKTFEGTVGSAKGSAYRPNVKTRTDFIVEGKLLAEVDEKLSRSLFPEIKKIFGFEVTHRELYKIGLYTGEKGGFFKQHRDNFDEPLGYRRLAMTLHLTDDYEGGGLHFPEYDEHVYRPAKGSAIVFSCATLHEALPVIKGERFVVVGFFHGDEDEAFRRHYQASQEAPLKIPQHLPTLRQYPGLDQSRDFYKEWRQEHVTINDNTAAASTAAAPSGDEPMNVKTFPARPNVMINTIGNHKPKKIFESKAGIIFDDFLPEDVYEKIYDHAVTTDYEYINTKGKISRAWHVHDGFPLRSSLNLFYHAEGLPKPQGSYVYPTQTPLDAFVDHILASQEYVNHITGKQTTDWAHFSVTSWLYPQGTGLAMHDDGSGVYSGAYVYFLNPVWRPHWGGLLLLADEDANKAIHEHRQTAADRTNFYRRKWLHANQGDELLMETGLAQCIMPKRNRIVFIANDAYHMVTRVNEQAGDNLRMSLAGFFDRGKKKNTDQY